MARAGVLTKLESIISNALHEGLEAFQMEFQAGLLRRWRCFWIDNR